MTAVALRMARHARLRDRLARLDDDAIRALVGDGEPRGGWGRHQTVEVDGDRLFVKRIPVTDLEAGACSTRNLYDLPPHYNYGVGSAGFGVFRELAAHLKTTDWVLSGVAAAFPLLYHHRILPVRGPRPEPDLEWHRAYVEYWGGDANIGRYMLDRAQAGRELLLFLEHFPHTLAPWLVTNPGAMPRVLDDLRDTIALLGSNGIVHFDAHFWNVLTDGRGTYLSDFGLVLDRDFDLTREERAFLDQHAQYDYGEVLSCVDGVLHAAYEALSPADRQRVAAAIGLGEDAQHGEVRLAVLANIERLSAEGALALDRGYVDSVVRHRPVIALMNAFYSDMRANNRKDTPFPHDELRTLLRETGFLPVHP